MRRRERDKFFFGGAIGTCAGYAGKTPHSSIQYSRRILQLYLDLFSLS